MNVLILRTGRPSLAASLLLWLLAVSPASADTLTVTWDPNSQTVAGYVVYMGTQSGSLTQRYDVGNTITFTNPNAVPGQVYCFQVAAYFVPTAEGPRSAQVCGYADQYPTLANPGNQSSAIGQQVGLQLLGNDPDGLPVTYNATGLPAGLTLGTGTGFIGGAPTSAGTYTVTARVSDGVLQSAPQTFTWSVTTAPAVDTTPPSVSITVPTSNSSYTALSSTLGVSGTATDNVGVTAVTWTNDRGGSGTATGTTSWSVPSIALQSGTNIITIRARDAAGNQGMDVLTVTYSTSSEGDPIAPTVSISGPTSNSSYAALSSTLAVSGTASDNIGVTAVTWTNDRGGSGTAAGTTSWSVPSIALQSGANVITIRARDAKGNQGVDVLTVTYSLADSIPPTVTISTPTTQSTLATTSSSLTIGGTASDNVGVTQVTWVNDRGGSGTANGTSSWSVGGIILQTGTNVITVRARDAAGNQGTDVLTMTYSTTSEDVIAPTISIAGPTTGPSYSTTTSVVTLGGSSSDNVGVTAVTWTNNRGGAGFSSGTTSWSIPSVPLQGGTNVITVTAQDAANNKGTDVLTVTYNAPTVPAPDTTPPSVSISMPTSQPSYATTESGMALGGTSSDNVGVTQVSWVNNRGGSGVASGTTSWSVPAVALQTGDNVITVTARDAAGNQSSDVLTVSFSAPAPTPSPLIVLSATATYVGGGDRLRVILRWTQAQGRTVTVYRNTKVVTTTSNDNYTDRPGGQGPFSYRVCLTGTTVCSNTVTVTR
ncbi:MAG TPA: Ig-like domain-containing protein [Vicinamibacterales bacterium]|nr:Ig-like domain-containing protein [Vicinamibacterales bacterium]